MFDQTKLSLVDIEKSTKRFGDYHKGYFHGDGEPMAINHKYLAACCDGVGSTVLVLNKFNPLRIPPNQPVIKSSREHLADLCWSPFITNLLSVASDDGFINLFQVPEEEYFKADITKENLRYSNLQKKIVSVKFHPCSKDIAAACSFDKEVHVWNVGTAQTMDRIKIPEIPYCLNWNNNGSLLGTTCADRTVCVIDPRAERIINKFQSHEMQRNHKMLFLDRDYIFTAGSKGNTQREAKIFDLRNTSRPCIVKELDNYSSAPFPWYDIDTGLITVASRGENVIHFYRFDGQLTYIKAYKDPSGKFNVFGHSDKRFSDYKTNEYYGIFRENQGFIDIMSLKIIRSSNSYDPSLYPPTFNGVSVISASEWKSGRNVEYQRSRIEDIAAGKYTVVQSAPSTVVYNTVVEQPREVKETKVQEQPREVIVSEVFGVTPTQESFAATKEIFEGKPNQPVIQETVTQTKTESTGGKVVKTIEISQGSENIQFTKETEHKGFDRRASAPITTTTTLKKETYEQKKDVDYVDPHLPLETQIRILKQKVRELDSQLQKEKEENNQLREENFKYKIKLGI
ncbi:MAG: hypothetical protein MJ252_01165 [archaeon]|nr:hypothetical protein [archaeon]